MRGSILNAEEDLINNSVRDHPRAMHFWESVESLILNFYHSQEHLFLHVLSDNSAK